MPRIVNTHSSALVHLVHVQNIVLTALRIHSIEFSVYDDVHYSEPSPPMFPIDFPEHGAYHAAHDFIQDHPQAAPLASSVDVRMLLCSTYVRGLFQPCRERES